MEIATRHKDVTAAYVLRCEAQIKTLVRSFNSTDFSIFVLNKYKNDYEYLINRYEARQHGLEVIVVEND